MKIKELYLKNFCGFEEANFKFYNDNAFLPISAFFGPNGCGKSTTLEALRIIGNLNRIKQRNNDLFFRKLTYHTNYDPTLPHFQESQEPLIIEAIFHDGEHDKRAKITSEGVTPEGDFDGIVTQEIPGYNIVFFADADNPSNTQKFQLPNSAKEKFLDIAKVVYGYDISVDKDVIAQIGDVEEIYWQDLIINKGKTKVHYKSMSAGEKKVATLLRHLCNPDFTKNAEVLLIDNMEMHVYFERHAKMVDKILQQFPDKQFIVTSHSGDMLRHIQFTYGKECLFNVPEIKGEPITGKQLIP